METNGRAARSYIQDSYAIIRIPLTFNQGAVS